MLRVLISPFFGLTQDRMFFALEHSGSLRYDPQPFQLLRQILREHDIEISTWDMHPPESADIVYLVDLPPTRREWLDVRRRFSRARFILHLWENPITRPYAFVKRNHSDFDAILTYNETICDEKRYFHVCFPANVPAQPSPDIPFASRKPLVMVNTNLFLAMFTNRQVGTCGIPFLGPLLGGWPYPLRNLWQGENVRELYSRRRRLARCADKSYPGVLEVFGLGWSGEPRTWIHKWVRHQPYKCLVAPSIPSKHAVLPHYRFCIAFENAQMNCAWVTEKVFDAMNAGVVPIYLGPKRVSDYLCPEALVDARQFRNDAELLQFARDCGEDRWNQLRDNARRYLASSDIERYSAQTFARRVSEVILRVAASNQRGANHKEPARSPSR